MRDRITFGSSLAATLASFLVASFSARAQDPSNNLNTLQPTVDAADAAEKATTVGAGLQSLLVGKASPVAAPRVGQMADGLKTTAKIAGGIKDIAKVVNAQQQEGDIGGARETAQIAADKTGESLGMVGADLYNLLRGSVEVGEAPLAAAYTLGTMIGDPIREKMWIGHALQDSEYTGAESAGRLAGDAVDPLHMLRRRSGGEDSFDAEMRGEMRAMERRIGNELPGSATPARVGALRLPDSSSGPEHGDIYSRFDTAQNAAWARLAPAPPQAPPLGAPTLARTLSYPASGSTIYIDESSTTAADSDTEDSNTDDEDTEDDYIAQRRAEFQAGHGFPRYARGYVPMNTYSQADVSYASSPAYPSYAASSALSGYSGYSGYSSPSSSACDYSDINLRGFSLPDLQAHLKARTEECNRNQARARSYGGGYSEGSTTVDFGSLSGFSVSGTTSSSSSSSASSK